MPKPENYPPFAAHFDANQVPTIMGVVGSAGTADTGGTAQPLPVGVRENGALYVYNLGPAGAVTVAGTDPTSFLPARLTDGTNFYNASGGAGGGTFVNISTGTQQTLGTVGIVNTGTLAEVTVVPSVSNLAKGTILALAAGTITGGTLTNLVSGTINALASGTITTGTVSVTTGTVVLNTGTITTIAAGTQNTLGTVGVLNSQAAGTQQTLGTVGVVNNIVTGTLAALTTVTSVTNLVGGTIQRSSIPVQLGTPLVTVGTTATAVWGTLVAAAGAGTKQYVSRTSIVVTSGTVDVAVANGIGGSVGAGVLERGQFPQGGGITNNYDPVVVTSTNGTLAYWLGGAGTVAITVNYWQGV